MCIFKYEHKILVLHCDLKVISTFFYNQLCQLPKRNFLCQWVAFWSVYFHFCIISGHLCLCYWPGIYLALSLSNTFFSCCLYELLLQLPSSTSYPDSLSKLSMDCCVQLWASEESEHNWWLLPASALASRMRSRGFPPLFFSVDFWPRDFRKTDLLPWIR